MRLVIVLIIVGAVFLGGSDDVVDYSKYPIVYFDADSKWRVCPDGEDESYKLANNLNGDSIKFSMGGDCIYFMDGENLYYREANDPDADEEKIASDVVFFIVLGDTKNVLYKTDDGDLYFHDLKEKYRLAKNIEGIYVNYDYTKIMYFADGNKLYIRGMDEDDEPQKISNDVYANGGGYEDVPIWEEVLTDKGYEFDHVDSHEHITPYGTSAEWIKDKYASIDEHYEIDNEL